ncbi:MAG: redoxin domain-containing protein [Planctomycetota bacterium]|nr:redoxin domain-containing protein [Planctomycetota bacterium]
MMIFTRSFVVAAALCGFVGCAQDDDKRLDPQVIQLLDLEGMKFDLWQKPSTATVVLFARSDCPISNRYAPEIRRLYEAYHSRGVEFYLVYVDPREEPDAIRKHLQEYGYPCPGLRDPKHTLVAHCGAKTTPEAVVFGRNRGMTYRGRVNDLYVDFGQARTEPTTYDLADAIESTVSGRSVTNPRTKAIGCLIEDLKD